MRAMTAMNANARQFGTLWGIGVGPGDSEWLTLKGLQILQQVSVVAVPQNSRGEPGMAWTIARPHLPPDLDLLTLEFPFVVDTAVLQAAWDRSIARLRPILAAGRDVAFLAEGDVSFYSTFTHLARELSLRMPEVSIEAIPGVCSPLAAAAALGMPLSIWEEKVAILPVLSRPEDLDRALDWADVVVLMKVSSSFDRVWQRLCALNLLDRASLVEWVGSDRQKIHPTLTDLKGYRPPYFSVAIVRVRACPYAYPPRTC